MANGLIESINKIVREKLQDGMIRKNTKKWVRFLPDAVESWNNSIHEGQEHSPLWLFKSPEGDFEQEREDAYKKTEERARKAVEKTRSQTFKIGDIVRVAISAVSTKTRKMIKNREGKKVLVKWTPELYRVNKIIRSRSKDEETRQLPETLVKRIANLQYEVESLDGKKLITERTLKEREGDTNRRAVRLFASQMQLVAKKGDEIPEDAIQPYDLVKNLNLVESERGRVKPTTRKPREKKRKEPEQEPEEEHQQEFGGDDDFEFQQQEEEAPKPTKKKRRPREAIDTSLLADATPETYAIHRSTRSKVRK
jgi:hypothetical protein